MLVRLYVQGYLRNVLQYFDNGKNIFSRWIAP